MEFLLFLSPPLELCFSTCHLHLVPKLKSQAGAGILVSVGSVQSAVVGAGCIQLWRVRKAHRHELA